MTQRLFLLILNSGLVPAGCVPATCQPDAIEQKPAGDQCHQRILGVMAAGRCNSGEQMSELIETLETTK
jgi:hypothetical protein